MLGQQLLWPRLAPVVLRRDGVASPPEGRPRYPAGLVHSLPAATSPSRLAMPCQAHRPSSSRARRRTHPDQPSRPHRASGALIVDSLASGAPVPLLPSAVAPRSPDHLVSSLRKWITNPPRHPSVGVATTTVRMTAED